MVRRGDAGAGSAIGNVLWFLLAGWWLIPVTFRPFGHDIVSIEEAERGGLHQQAAIPG